MKKSIKSLLLSLCLSVTSLTVLAVTAGAAGETYVPLDLEGFNADVVVEEKIFGTTLTADDTITTATFFDGDNNWANYAYYSEAVESDGGLPLDRVISTTDSKNYLLNPYSENNSLQIYNGNTSGTLELSTYRKYSELSILCAGGNGKAVFNATVNYTDNTTSAVTQCTAYDWYGGPSADKRFKCGRIKIRNDYKDGNKDSRTAGSVDYNASNCPGLYEYSIAVDPNKSVESISFLYTEGTAAFGDVNAIANIMAISGVVVTTSETTIYNIYYETNGGVINSGEVTDYTVGTSVTLPTDVTKAHYTFEGWYEARDLSGSKVTAISASATGIKNYYAKWTPEIYDITVSKSNESAGTVTESLQADYGEMVTLEVTSNINFYFLGWYENDEKIVGEGVTSNAYSFVASSDRNIVAQFAPVNASFSLSADAGYYSDEFNGAVKEGVIAFNALFNQYQSYGDKFTDFGLYIYNTTNTDANKKATMQRPSSIEALRGALGYYYGLITEIDAANFGDSVVAVPFVVVDGKAYTGNPLAATVNGSIKWLGAKQ